MKTEVKDEWDRPSSAAPQGWAVTYEVSADRRRTRMHLPPLQVAGEGKSISIYMDLDAAALARHCYDSLPRSGRKCCRR